MKAKLHKLKSFSKLFTRSAGARILECVTSYNSRRIPKDVPKGHVAVYVGLDEQCSRYVVDIALLKHPLFRPLLDLAAEVFDFAATAKLCIPCTEAVFLTILHGCSSPRRRGLGHHGRRSSLICCCL